MASVKLPEIQPRPPTRSHNPPSPTPPADAAEPEPTPAVVQPDTGEEQPEPHPVVPAAPDEMRHFLIPLGPDEVENLRYCPGGMTHGRWIRRELYAFAADGAGVLTTAAAVRPTATLPVGIPASLLRLLERRTGSDLERVVRGVLQAAADKRRAAGAKPEAPLPARCLKGLGYRAIEQRYRMRPRNIVVE
jgi:hypothetical protein